MLNYKPFILNVSKYTEIVLKFTQFTWFILYGHILLCISCADVFFFFLIVPVLH